MDRIENIKKASYLIGKVGKVFQIVFGIFTGMFLISLIILFVLRSTLNTMIVESQTSFDFSNMGYWTKKLASEGKVAEASIVFLISGILFSLILRLDRVMADRKISLNDLAEQVGIANVNLSKIKTGKVSAIRFSTLNAICDVLDCQPGDILEFQKDQSSNKTSQANK